MINPGGQPDGKKDQNYALYLLPGADIKPSSLSLHPIHLAQRLRGLARAIENIEAIAAHSDMPENIGLANLDQLKEHFKEQLALFKSGEGSVISHIRSERVKARFDRKAQALGERLDKIVLSDKQSRAKAEAEADVVMVGGDDLDKDRADRVISR